MTDSSNWNPEADAQRKRKRKYAVLNALKLLRPILNLAFIMCIVILMVFIAPYVSGKEVFENPMTESQLQAIVFMLFLIILLKWKK